MPETSGYILLADGDRSSRSVAVAALRRIGHVTREASTGDEALAIAARSAPTVAVLDVGLPGVSGYQVCHELRERLGAQVAIIFVSADRAEPADRVAGLLVGADDYLVKPFDPDELLARVRRFIARPATTANGDGPTYDLTRRESEILDLLAAGRQTAEIARELVISPKTVGAHIQRILGKLDVHTQAQAVGKAYRERLVDRVPS